MGNLRRREPFPIGVRFVGEADVSFEACRHPVRDQGRTRPVPQPLGEPGRRRSVRNGFKVEAIGSRHTRKVHRRCTFVRMPLPPRLARFNRRVTNRVTRPIAGRLPGFAIVRHRGRRTGRLYRTPVNLFRRDDSVVIALTYGPDRDWVRNVMAAGGCEVETRGRVLKLNDPRLVTDTHRNLVPAPVRPVLGAIDVTQFLVLTAG